MSRHEQESFSELDLRDAIAIAHARVEQIDAIENPIERWLKHEQLVELLEILYSDLNEL